MTIFIVFLKVFLKFEGPFSNQKLIDFYVFLLVFLGIAPETPPRCPKTPQDVPRTRQEASKTRQIRLQTAPKTRQDGHKTAPDAPRRLQDSPKTPQDAPKMWENSANFGTTFGIPFKPRSWSVLGWILDRFRVDFGRFWDGFWNVFQDGFWQVLE